MTMETMHLADLPEDLPPDDRFQVESLVAQYGACTLLRCMEMWGSQARGAMLEYHKEHGELPPYSQVVVIA